MNFIKRTIQILAASSLVAMSASPALAGLCSSQNRAFPPPAGTLVIAMSCQHSPVTATTGSIGSGQDPNGTQTTSALLSTTAAGFAANATTIGIDINGAQIASCKAVDTTTTGGADVKFCNAGVRWRGSITFKE
jgi:hypothetical protein